MVASGCFRCHTVNALRGPVGGDLVAGGPPDAPGGADDGETDEGDSPGGFRLGDFLAQPLLQTLDRDKDGKLTKDELVVGVKQFFKNQDKDKVGKLSQKEISEGLSAIITTPGSFWGSRKPAYGLGELFAPGVVRRADADKDGKVTQAELVAAAEALFQEYDRDKKGKLGEKEIAKAINWLGTSPENAPGVKGPDLGNVGQDPAHTVDWFKAQIRSPKSHKPKARMPSFEGKIKDEDLNALAEYLTNMK
jgi:mono/diheme cytochrome c family protein